MQSAQKDSFVVSMPDVRSTKSEWGIKIAELAFLLISAVMFFDRYHTTNQYYQFITFGHSIFVLYFLFFVLVGALVYAASDRNRYQVRLAIDAKRIFATHLYNGKVIKEYELMREQIKDMSLEVRIVNQKLMIKKTLLRIVGDIPQDASMFVLPWNIVPTFFAYARELHYPISSSIDKTMRNEEADRDTNKFIIRFGSIGIVFLIIFTIAIVALYYYLGGT